MTTTLADRLLVATAALFAAGSLAWFGLKRAPVRPGPAAVAWSTSVYAPASPASPAAAMVKWAPPPAQRAGRQWVYDVFSPPEIFYDARTRQFTVTPPDAETERARPPFGVTLRRVERKLYPLQLVGYAGARDHYRGVFENVATAETFLAGSGRPVESLGLTIIQVEVQPAALMLPESTTAHPLAATAVVRDTRSGEEVTLSSRERRFIDAPVACIAPTDAPDELHEVREGETLSLGAARYTIEKIQLAPPSVDITKQAADLPEPDRQTLAVPPEPAAAPLSPSNS